MFYVNLRGQGGRATTRTEALRAGSSARPETFQYSGRFDFSRVRQLDNRGAVAGTQFNYKITKDGEPSKTIPDAMLSESFLETD